VRPTQAISLLWFLPLLLLAGGCERFLDQAAVRSARAHHNGGEVRVGVAWPSERIGGFDPGLSFKEGVELGLETEGSLPRKIVLVPATEDGTSGRAKAIAAGFAEDQDLIAVIGHRDADGAAIASVIYEYDNVLFVSAGSSDRRLGRAGFERTFRLMPTDEELGSALADYASEHRLKSVGIVYANDEPGRAMANAFESRTEAHRGTVSRVSFEHGGIRALDRSLTEFAHNKVDAILLADRLPEAALVLTMIRNAGLAVPVLSGDGLDAPDLPRQPEAEGVVVATAFTPGADGAGLVKAYRQKHTEDPDTWAAAGYDAIRLVAEAMIASQSAAPEDLARALRREGGFKTAAGVLRFGTRGEAIGRTIRMKRVAGGHFVPET
jgi:branched-chain amino acid transport system substrate-binding protein